MFATFLVKNQKSIDKHCITCYNVLEVKRCVTRTVHS